jgi:hypothetical protein
MGEEQIEAQVCPQAFGALGRCDTVRTVVASHGKSPTEVCMLSCLALAALLLMGGKTPDLPGGELFGVSLGMSQGEVHATLADRGVLAVEGGKETWKLDDKRYETLFVRYDGDWRVKWATAFALKDGPRVKYKDVGDLDQAEYAGRHIYNWIMWGGDKGPGYGVSARGQDPEYLSSLSLFPLNMASRAAAETALPDSMWLESGPR